MPPLTQQKIEVYRGERVILSFTMDPVENIVGWTLKFTVTKSVNKTTKVLGPLDMTITSGVDGEFEITLTEENLDIKPGTYYYDVWRFDEGFEEVKAIGTFIVHGNARVPPTE